MEDNLKDQMTEAHALAATQESVEHKAAILADARARHVDIDEETPVLVHEAFVQTEDMVQGTPVLM